METINIALSQLKLMVECFEKNEVVGEDIVKIKLHSKAPDGYSDNIEANVQGKWFVKNY